MPEWIISLQDRVIKRFPISEGDRLTIGRGNEADIRIDNTAISRLHSAISLKNGIYFLEDLKSLNGTFHNGEKIETETLVSTEDTIAIGKFRLHPAGEDHPGETTTSVAAAMDLDDATVFVTSKKKPMSAPSQNPHEKKGEHRLAVTSGDATPSEFVLDGRSSIKIGKEAASDIRVQGWLIAAAQCYIVNKEGRFVLIPQKSWSGTYLNGLRIKDPHPLRPGDVIGIRRVKIKYE